MCPAARRWSRSAGRGSAAFKVLPRPAREYITLTEDDLRGTGMDMSGAKYVCSPPPRDRESHAGGLAGHRGRVVPDLLLRPLPVPLRRPGGQAGAEGRTSFRWVPNGIPGIETRLPILFSEGVSKGRISLAAILWNSRRRTTPSSMASTRGRADRRRLRRRYHALGPEAAGRPSGRRTCITAPTTRHGRAFRSPAGR